MLNVHSDSQSNFTSYVTLRNISTYKITATCIEHATTLRVNNTRVTHIIKQVKVCLAIHDR